MQFVEALLHFGHLRLLVNCRDLKTGQNISIQTFMLILEGSFFHFPVLSCHTLLEENCLLTYIPEYEDIFGSGLREQAYIASLMFENLRRKKILEYSN